MRPSLSMPAPGGVREILRVAVPLVISTGSLTLMQFCDRMFLSWYHADAFRAVLPSGILSFTLICGFLALVGYGGTFVAQYHGAGDGPGCGRATAQALWLALLCWPAVLALMPLGGLILRWSGHGPAVLALEWDYFSILMLGSLPNLLNSAWAGFFSGRGDTRATMVANVSGNLLNIGLDWLMIFGHGGFPEMGIRGAAWATVISGLVPPVLLAARYFGPRMAAACATRRTWRFDAPLFRRLVRFGLPAGGHLFLDLTSFTFFVLLAGSLGPAELAASNLALSVNTLAFMPMLGLGIASSIVVGQYQGRRDSRTAERAGWTTLKMAAGYMAAMGVTYVLFPGFYIAIYTRGGADGLNFAEVFPVARTLLVMLALWGVGDACDIVLAGALKGAGDTRFVMLYSLAMAYGLFVAGLLVLVRVFHAGLYGIWARTVFYIWTMALGYLGRFARGPWRRIDLLGRGEPPGVDLIPPRPGTEGMVTE